MKGEKGKKEQAEIFIHHLEREKINGGGVGSAIAHPLQEVEKDRRGGNRKKHSSSV